MRFRHGAILRFRHIEILTGILLITLLFVAGPAGATGRIEAERAFVDAQKALASGDNVSAEKHLMKALQCDASFTSAIWQLSQIYEKRGKLEYARELILRGLQQDPGAAWAREKLGQLERILTRKLLNEAESYMSSGSYSKAVPKLSLYLGIKPHDPIPLEMLGRCHLSLGNLQTSKEYLIQAVQRDPSNRDITSLLDKVDERISRSSVDAMIGRARSVLADYAPENREKAENALQEVLRIDPENEWAKEKLGELALISAQKDDPVKDNPVEEGTKQAKEAIEKSIDAVKTMDNPIPRTVSILRSNMTLGILLVAIALLVLNLRKKSRLRSYPLQGSLNLIPILDIVSLLNSNLKTGRLQLTYSRDRGEIFFEKGEIVHSRFKSFDGRTAFHRLMDIKSGKFVFYNHLPNIKHTITEPLSLLLLSMKSREQSKAQHERQQGGKKP
ncbi:MAG: DUF4388 domain-containing protein, partial [Candidatus Krumholzibacteria bacterium]|nr:DUF4388 domain-containing protein [Candidatus Krumholzibacteria bacterium]